MKPNALLIFQETGWCDWGDKIAAGLSSCGGSASALQALIKTQLDDPIGCYLSEQLRSGESEVCISVIYGK